MCAAANPCPIPTSLQGLAQRERILLWVMRAWVVGITQKIPVEEQIHDAFRRIGAPDGAIQLYAFMWILSQGASRVLNVECVCCRTVTADERTLLDIVSLSQHGHTFEAMILLRSMVKGPRALATSEHAEAVGKALADAGFLLPARRLPSSLHGFTDRAPRDCAHAAPTLH